LDSLKNVIKGIFSAAMDNGETESFEAKFRKTLLRLKLNADECSNLVSAIEGSLLNLKEDILGDEDRMVEVRLWTTQLLKSFYDFVKSQTGLENIDTDASLRNDSANAKLFKHYDDIVAFFNKVRDQPKEASEYFGEAEAKDLAQFVFALYEFVNRVRN
jgi:hypothetical protein